MTWYGKDDESESETDELKRRMKKLEDKDKRDDDSSMKKSYDD